MGDVKSLDELLREILAPFQIVTAAPGEILTCAACGKIAEVTYRGTCGECFLAGRVARGN